MARFFLHAWFKEAADTCLLNRLSSSRVEKAVKLNHRRARLSYSHQSSRTPTLADASAAAEADRASDIPADKKNAAPGCLWNELKCVYRLTTQQRTLKVLSVAHGSNLPCSRVKCRVFNWQHFRLHGGDNKFGGSPLIFNFLKVVAPEFYQRLPRGHKIYIFAHSLNKAEYIKRFLTAIKMVMNFSYPKAKGQRRSFSRTPRQHHRNYSTRNISGKMRRYYIH